MRQLKLCVLNYSGNVGKSTFSRHVLLPRLSGARYFAIESINADEGSEDNEEALRGQAPDDVDREAWATAGKNRRPQSGRGGAFTFM